MESKLQATSLKKKVAVGLSGGVDSSVSAALLIDQGYDVTGVFLTCWDETRPGCRIDQDRKDALDIALQLGIPFVALDFKKEYKEKVIDYFYREYQAGRTPNPDTMCNREIKFGMFYDWALGNKYDYVATGHYARVAEPQATSHKRHADNNGNIDSSIPLRSTQNDIVADRVSHIASGKQKPYAISHTPYALQRGIDEKKDQSYFLYQLRPEQLQHILFPIGHLTKEQVRAEAKKRGFKTATKPDSQGICFIGDIDVQDFLRERIEEEEGEVKIQIANSKWQIANSQQKPYAISHKPYAYKAIGQHHGVPFYTIGQKVGQEIDQSLVAKLVKQGVLDFDTTKMPPLFVIAKDVATNTLIVGTEAETYRREFEVGEVNWLVGESVNQIPPKADQPRAEISKSDHEKTDNRTNRLTDKPLCVRIRHGGELVKAEIDSSTPLLSAQNDKVTIRTTKPIKGVAPGQACVFYSEDSVDALVLGGGIIV